MVVVPKPKQIKSEKYLHKSVQYILNPQKTNEQVLVGGYHINNLNFADVEMNYTKILARQMVGRQNKQVLAHHLVQSFRPEDGLSPEEIHQIGIEWIKQLTGGKHEYIIATHIDKEHIHNHIIFNATSDVDFKNFRWKKDTLQIARELSDKISLEHGALQEKVKPYSNNHRSYQTYLSENPIRPELRQRLLFLMKHTISVEDFFNKARALNVAVDFSKKYATYQLLDKNQKAVIRDSSLISKADQKKMEAHPEKRIFSLEQIKSRCEQNKAVHKIVLSEKECLAEYEKQQKWFSENTNIDLTIEPWQIEKETARGIFIRVQAGHRDGSIRCDARQFEKAEDGTYRLYLNTFSKFIFLDERDAAKSSILYGGQIIAQLSNENTQVPLHNNQAMTNVHTLFDAMNLLSRHGITGQNSFKHLGEDFISEMQKVEQALDELNEKIARQTAVVKFDQHNLRELSQLKNLQVERQELEQSYQQITRDLEIYDKLEAFNQKNIQVQQPKNNQEDRTNVKR